MNTFSSLENTVDRVLLGTFSGSMGPLGRVVDSIAPSPLRNRAHDTDFVGLTRERVLEEIEGRVAVDMDSRQCAKAARDVLSDVMQGTYEDDGPVRWEGLSPTQLLEAARACRLLAKCLVADHATVRLVPPVLHLLWSLVDGRPHVAAPTYSPRRCLTTNETRWIHPAPAEFPFTRPDTLGRAAACSEPSSHMQLKAGYEEAVGAYYRQIGRRSEALVRYSSVYASNVTVFGAHHPRTYDALLAILELHEEGGVTDIRSGLGYLDALLTTANLEDEGLLLVWARLRRLQATYAVNRERFTEAHVCLRDVTSVLDTRPYKSLLVARLLALAQLQCSELETCDDGEGPAGVGEGFRRFQQANRILVHMYPPDHPLRLHATCRLAALFVRRAVLEGFSQQYLIDPRDGGLSQEGCFERAVTLMSVCLGEAKVDTTRMDVLSRYGDFLFEAGLVKLAEGFYALATGLAQTVLGTDHVAYLTLVYKLCTASVCSYDPAHPRATHASWHAWAEKDLQSLSGVPLADFDSPESMVVVLLAAFEAGLPTPPAAQLYHLQGSLFRVRGDTQSAQRMLEAALATNPSPPQCCRILDALGTVAEAQGDLEEAVRLTHRSLVVRRGRLGDRHVDVAATHGNLAALYHKASRWADSISSADNCCGVLREVAATRLLKLNDEAFPHAAIVRERVFAAVADHPLYRQASQLRAESIKARKSVQ